MKTRIFYFLCSVFYLGMTLPQAQGASITDPNEITVNDKTIVCANAYFEGITADCNACTTGDDSVINWYDANGNLVFTGDTFVPNTSIPDEYTYFVECVCGSYTSNQVETTVVVADCSCDDECAYFLVLTDEAANGWDGASIYVSLNEAWPGTSYKLSPEDGECSVIPLCINENGTIDLEYWNGALETEHGFYLLDAQGNIAVDNTGTPVSYDGNIPAQTPIRIKTTCPSISCAGTTEDFTVRITLGMYAIEQSWEIYEGAASTTAQGNQVIGINATAYAAFAPGTELYYPISLDKCATYTFVSFDGYNDGWDFGTWEILTDNLNYGTEITDLQDSDYGDAVLIASPNSPFFSLSTDDIEDEDKITFTIPCEPTCTDEVVFDDDANCNSGEPVVLPIAVPEVCYPNAEHAKPDGCIGVQHIVLINSALSNLVPSVALEGSIHPYTGQTEMEFDGGADLFGAEFEGVLPLGCHKYITKYTYCDGIVLKCTAEINVITEANPPVTCNDNVIISLANPDRQDDNLTGSLSDDLNECVICITPEMVLHIPESECPDVFKDFAFNEYEVIVYDTDGTPLVVTEDVFGLPLDKLGQAIFPGDQTEPAHNLVSTSQLMQTLNYTVRHKFSNNTCWGTITVEDKAPPQIICSDYDLSCTHPHALDERYEETINYSAQDELPANIAGGVPTSGLQSNTWIPINTTACIAAGEVIRDIQIKVRLSHEDVTDLQIFLHLPAALDAAIVAAGGTAGPYLLADNTEVETNNTFRSRNGYSFVPELQELLERTCAEAQTTNPENFVTENNGAATPANLGETWYIQIVNNDESGETTVYGGEVIAASIDLTCGFPTPAFAYDCSLQELNLLDERVVETNCDQSDWNGAQIVRVWQAIDSYGNGTTCTQTVNLKAPTMDDIEKPSDITLECEGQTPESITPEVSGGPIFGCYQLTENHHGLCDMSYTYEDKVLPTCGDAFKIIRTWTIINWCSGVTKQHEQIIKVEDTEGPAIAQDNVTVSTDTYECTADVSLEDLGITDNCSGLQTATASYIINPDFPGGSELVVVDFTKGEILEYLPMGVTTVTITATDLCLNSTEKDITITVEDLTVPIAICDDQLKVSLTGDGTAQIYAIDVDEGSFDNCGDITLEVRRVDGCLGTTPWDEYVPFEYCDVDELVTVELRVTDAVGNTNICWENVFIKAFDDEVPVIDCPYDQTICDQTNACEGAIDLTIDAVGGCSSDEALEYTYKIDIDNDGTFDVIEKSKNATGIYSYGTHLIRWIVEDGCGNTSACQYLFTVEDCKKPTPLCLNGLFVPAINSNGCVEIWARDLLNKAWDNCSSDAYVENSVKIRRLGTEDPLESNITFCCDELGTALVEVWVWDEAGNADFCETYIVIEDGTGNCMDALETVTIAGSIQTEIGNRIEDVTVYIEGGTIDDAMSTDTNGHYVFANIPMHNNYMVIPEKDNDPLNGVNVYDLLLIIQHILDIRTLDSPYKLIAADVNNDGKITTFDVIRIAQLILSIIEDYPENSSWRFVDADYVFPDLQNPWIEIFPEAIEYINIDQDQLESDFVSIKIGDISGNANLVDVADRNVVRTTQFILEDQVLVAGQKTRIDFRAKDFTKLNAYQFSLQYDVNALTFAGLQAGVLNVTEANFGLSLLEKGFITTLWYEAVAQTVAEDEILFSLDFVANKNIKLSEVFAISSRYTKAEAYTGTDLVDLILGFQTDLGVSNAVTNFALYQNEPNPFNEITRIGFDLPAASSATLTIYDVSGKALYTTTGDYAKGYNQITISKKDLQVVGVLYYQLETDTNTATKKMIVVE